MHSEMTEKMKQLLLIIMIVGCFFSTLNQTLLNVAFSELMAVFQVSETTVQWLATGFMLVNGVLVPVTAFLMKRFSTRQLFMSSMGFLLVGSIVAACATNFSMVLTGRMVQAVGAGILIPLMMTVIVFLFPKEKRGQMMGKVGFAIIFAPAIAPTLAGFILEYLSWRWLFIMMIPVTLLVIAVAFKLMVNVSEPEKVELDVLSIVYSTVGFGLLLFGFSSAGGRGWGDWLVISSIVVGLVVTWLFVRRQLHSPEPLLNLTVFKYKMFSMTTIINIAITILMYADLILLPIYLQDGRSANAFIAGLVLLPGAILNAVLSPTAGKLFDKFGAKPMFIAGTGLLVLSMLLVLDVSPETSIAYIVVRTIILRIGLTCITMPLNTAALNALPQELATHGSAVNNTVRQLAGAVGTAVIVTVYATNLTDSTVSNATGDTYFFMLIIAVIAFVLALFTPKKRNVI